MFTSLLSSHLERLLIGSVLKKKLKIQVADFEVKQVQDILLGGLIRVRMSLENISKATF